MRRLGRIVLAGDPVAADATCARPMGIDPRPIFHIAEAGRFLGNMDQNRITMLAEGMPRNTEPFRVLPQFQNLRSRHEQRARTWAKTLWLRGEGCERILSRPAVGITSIRP